MLPPGLPQPAFANAWTPDELAQARRLLDRTLRVAEGAGVSPMIEGGTLLGHVRHDGRVIPWDDDLDLLVQLGEFERVVAALAAAPDLEVRTAGHRRFGLFATVWAREPLRPAPPSSRSPNGWPFIDLFRHACENDRVVLYPDGSARTVLDAVDLLPSRPARFEGVPVHVPARPDRVLDALYPNWRIEFDSGGWNHRDRRRRWRRCTVRWNPAARPQTRVVHRIVPDTLGELWRRLGSRDGSARRAGAGRRAHGAARATRVVYTDMCADLFHAGHVNFLRQARALGGRLVVGIHSDTTIAGYKDPPVQTMAERIAVVAACRYVDQVVPDAPLAVSPRYLDALGVDVVCHADDLDAAARERMYGEILATHGLELVPYTPGISSTALRERVLGAGRGSAGESR